MDLHGLFSAAADQMDREQLLAEFARSKEQISQSKFPPEAKEILNQLLHVQAGLVDLGFRLAKVEKAMSTSKGASGRQ